MIVRFLKDELVKITGKKLNMCPRLFFSNGAHLIRTPG